MSSVSSLCKDKSNALSKITIKHKNRCTSLKKLIILKKLRTETTSVPNKLELVNSKHKFKAKKQTVPQTIENNEKVACNAFKNDLKELRQLERNLNKCKSNQKNPIKQPKHESQFMSINFKLKDHEILEDLIAIKRSLLLLKPKENADQ